MNPSNPLPSQNPSNTDQASLMEPRPAGETPSPPSPSSSNALPGADRETGTARPTDTSGSADPTRPVEPSGHLRPPLRDRLPSLRGAGGIALAAMLLIGLLGWQWVELGQRVSQTREQMAQRLAESGNQLREARAVAAAAQASLQEQASKIVVLETRVSVLQDSHAALEGLYQELARGRDEWLLAEVDQLVGLATQQLQLAGNVQGALLALGNADARLARSERTQFISLRKAIARDLQKLRGVTLVDVAGISLKLENAALAVDQMTLAFEARPQASPQSPAAPAVAKTRSAGKENPKEATPPPGNELALWWQRWTSELWGDVRNLIRVERFDRPDPAVLAPQHAVFLRENLKLRLLGARLALLGRDQTTFKGELRQAVQWLERYFDPRDRAVASALESLKPLIASDLSIDPPALTESQAALRTIKLASERTSR